MKEKNQLLKRRVAHLEKQISTLVTDSVGLLKIRCADLGIVAEHANDVISQAKAIMLRHHDLQVM